MATPTLEEQVARLVPLELGETIVATWAGSDSPVAAGRVVLTTHRFLAFRTKGVFHPVLDSLSPTSTFRLEAIPPPSFQEHTKGGSWLEVGGVRTNVVDHVQEVAAAVIAARLHRRAELGLP